MTLWLHGLGHHHPETEITNRFLEELDIGTTDAWIVERVGIRARRTVLPLDYLRTTRNADVRASAEAAELTNAQLGAEAARMAIARAGIEPEQVGLVVSGSSAPDVTTPPEACVVAAELGIESPAFDINSACTSFLVELDVLSRMADTLPDFVLALGIDAMTKVTDYGDRASAVLWGDGAAAAVLSPRVPGRARVLGTSVASDPGRYEKVVVPRAGYFGQDGRAVQMFAIKKSAEGFEHLRREYAEPGRPLHLIGHQANLRMLEAVARRCDVAPERHHTHVEWFGNTGAPGAASVASQHWDKWQAHDDIAWVGVGGGLTWARALLRFEEN